MPRIVVILTVLAMLGCQNTPKQAVIPSDTLTDEVIEAHLQLKIEDGSELFHHTAAVQLSRDEFRTILFSDYGQPIMTISVKGADFQSKKLIPLVAAPAAGPLTAALQRILWPGRELEQYLQKGNWRIILRDKRREFYLDESLAAYVDYDKRCPWLGEALYIDTLNDYRIRLKSKLLTELKDGTDCSI